MAVKGISYWANVPHHVSTSSDLRSNRRCAIGLLSYFGSRDCCRKLHYVSTALYLAEKAKPSVENDEKTKSSSIQRSTTGNKSSLGGSGFHKDLSLLRSKFLAFLWGFFSSSS